MRARSDTPLSTLVAHARRDRERERAGRGRREHRLSTSAPPRRQRAHYRGRAGAGCLRIGVSGVAPARGPAGPTARHAPIRRRTDGPRRGGLPYPSSRGAGYDPRRPRARARLCGPGVGGAAWRRSSTRRGRRRHGRRDRGGPPLRGPASRCACWKLAPWTWAATRCWPEPLAGAPGERLRLRLHDDAAAARQRAHRALAGPRARRLLVARHADLVEPLPLDWTDWVDKGPKAGTTSGWILPRPHSGAAQDRGRAGPRPVPARLDQGRGGRRRRAGQPGLELRAVLRRRRLPRRRLRPGHGRPLLLDVMYLHPIMACRDNLSIQCESRALRLEVRNGRATGVHVVREGGIHDLVEARRRDRMACGTIDSPRLLLSRHRPEARPGAARHRRVHDLPGVGET